MEKVLVDSCIFIDIFRGDKTLSEKLKEISVCINPVVYMELLQGARNKIELEKIDKYLSKFELITLDDRISRTSIDLIRAYSKSHGLLFPDSLIASTCLESTIKLFTRNLKDFTFINRINIYVTE